MGMPEADVFADRAEAGRALVDPVSRHLRDQPRPGRPLVLGLPRGGLPVAVEVARGIDADLDVTVARKIGLPWQPELGVGAVTGDGPPVFNTDLLHEIGMDPQDLDGEVAGERAEARRRAYRYRAGRPEPAIAGRVAVVVDDGLATGITARAALRAVRQRQPSHLVLAAPVCSPEAAGGLAAEADAIVCVRVPSGFAAVGQWYADFPQLSDHEVERLLAAGQRAVTGT